jgi:hypothetical protein
MSNMLPKLVLILFFVIVVNAQSTAQVDTAKVKIKSDTSQTQSQPVVLGKESPSLKSDIPFSTENSVAVEPNQVPPELRKTLEESEYQGWENGLLLRHLQTGEYKLEWKSQTDKVFYFTRSGERKNGP